jgi:hypothetical protein
MKIRRRGFAFFLNPMLFFGDLSKLIYGYFGIGAGIVKICNING